MTNKEKFLKLVSTKKSSTMEDVRWRIANREMLRESGSIALKVLSKLDELGWTQLRLAEEMKVTPQQITKIVSGKENLTIQTMVKLQRILNIPILASFYEEFESEVESETISYEKLIDTLPGQSLFEYSLDSKSTSVYSLNYDKVVNDYHPTKQAS